MASPMPRAMPSVRSPGPPWPKTLVAAASHAARRAMSGTGSPSAGSGRAGIEVQDAAAVAEDDVAARAAVDRVVALAAEDDQRQRAVCACTVSSSAPSALGSVKRLRSTLTTVTIDQRAVGRARAA